MMPPSPDHGDELTATHEEDGMAIDCQVPMPMSDGAVLRADVFRPPGEARYRVFDGEVNVGPEHPSRLLIPVLPPEEET